MYRLPALVDRILSSPTPSVLLDRMDRELEVVGVASFILLRFAHSGDPLDKWIVGLRDAAEFLDKYLYSDDPSASPVIQHARTVVEPFFWYDVADELRVRRARANRLPEGLVIPVPGPRGCVGVEWMGASGEGRAELKKFCIVIQAIGLACYYHLERYYGPPPPSSPHLTVREREILNLVAQGLSSSAIARMLRLSERTVEWHVKQAMKKLDAKNRIQAVVLAIRHGLIAP
jgi:DNA-binding CsgD family transcriptional regulator